MLMRTELSVHRVHIRDTYGKMEQTQYFENFVMFQVPAGYLNFAVQSDMHPLPMHKTAIEICIALGR